MRLRSETGGAVAFGFALAWTLRDFLLFPTDRPFPYAVVLPTMLVALFGLGWSGRRLLVRFRKPLLVGAGAVLLLSAFLQGWGFVKVASLPAPAGAAVSQAMQDATVAMEDGGFYDHRGFDFEAMHRALRVDVRVGRIRQGGSTISQQLAKSLFLSRGRNVGRKILEIPLTVALECRFTKAKILRLYLRTIPYGRGYRGVDAAARGYFGTTADRLTVPHATMLAGLVPHDPARLPDVAMLHRWRLVALRRLFERFPERYDAGDPVLWREPGLRRNADRRAGVRERGGEERSKPADP